jgi:hypothetical protein
VTTVMGLDQQHGQITAGWLDTTTGEVSRARIAPAGRAGVGCFAERFAARRLRSRRKRRRGGSSSKVQAAGARE